MQIGKGVSQLHHTIAQHNTAQPQPDLKYFSSPILTQTHQKRRSLGAQHVSNNFEADLHGWWFYISRSKCCHASSHGTNYLIPQDYIRSPSLHIPIRINNWDAAICSPSPLFPLLPPPVRTTEHFEPFLDIQQRAHAAIEAKSSVTST